MAAVKNLCSRAVWLDHGKVRKVGEAEPLVIEYLNEGTHKQAAPVSQHGLQLIAAELRVARNGLPVTQPIFGEDHELYLRLAAERPFARAGIVVQIKNAYGELISSICTPEEGIAPFELKGETEVRIALRPLRLFPGRYTADVLVFRPNDMTRYLDGESVLTFEVHAGVIADGMWAYQSHHGYVRIADEVLVKV
jgi:lipopolysaccharide transport system ATP-binding protein